jgi:hypothetical protein
MENSDRRLAKGVGGLRFAEPLTLLFRLSFFRFGPP